MQGPSDQVVYAKVLRWMVENLELSSSVYRTTSGSLRVDPALVTTRDGHVVRRGTARPRTLRAWHLNAATALIACCYIDALGKVVTKNKKAGLSPNLRRFRSFILAYMPDLVAECRRRGGRFSVKTLYSTFRNGFVHQYASRTAHWDRRGRHGPYWFMDQGEPGLNVDRLVHGVIQAIQQFRQQFPVAPTSGRTPYANFRRWLGA